MQQQLIDPQIIISNSSSVSIMSDMTVSNNTNNNTNTNYYQNITYEDALDDVHTRFILNLPSTELQTADRIFIQLEQAWWYYEDIICDSIVISSEDNNNNKNNNDVPQRQHPLPRYTHLRPFAKELFEYSSVLPNDTASFNSMWKEYSIYKKKISNYGCILLSADYQNIVLCQMYNISSSNNTDNNSSSSNNNNNNNNNHTYTLPSGKINEGEDGVTAAARETYEETGFDPSCLHGLTAQWKQTTPEKITWNTDFLIKDKLVYQDDMNNNNSNNEGTTNGKRRTCYIIVGVPMDFPFLPVCRKEVSAVLWFPLNAIPKNTFAVLPFMKKLRKWIYNNNNNSNITSEQFLLDDKGQQQPRDKSKSRPQQQQHKKSRERGGRNNTNNSNKKGIQHNNNNNNNNTTNIDDYILTPFFADDGTTPWGEVVPDAVVVSNDKSISSSSQPSSLLSSSIQNDAVNSIIDNATTIPIPSIRNNDNTHQIMSSSTTPTLKISTETNKITESNRSTSRGQKGQKKSTSSAKSSTKNVNNNNNNNNSNTMHVVKILQKEKPKVQQEQVITSSENANNITNKVVTGTTSTASVSCQKIRQLRREQYEQNLIYINEWVNTVLCPPSSSNYTTTSKIPPFTLDVNAIMIQAEKDVAAANIRRSAK